MNTGQSDIMVAVVMLCEGCLPADQYQLTWLYLVGHAWLLIFLEYTLLLKTLFMKRTHRRVASRLTDTGWPHSFGLHTSTVLQAGGLRPEIHIVGYSNILLSKAEATDTWWIQFLLFFQKLKTPNLHLLFTSFILDPKAILHLFQKRAKENFFYLVFYVRVIHLKSVEKEGSVKLLLLLNCYCCTL